MSPVGVAGRPPKKSNVGVIIGICVGVVVLLVVTLAIIGAVSDSTASGGDTTPSSVASGVNGPGKTVPATVDSISAEFPRMVPATKSEQVGYNGAKCWETDATYTPSPSEGDPEFGDWAWQWRCYGGGDSSDPLYRIYVYKSAADVQAVLNTLPANTKSTDTNGGKSYTNYKYDTGGPKIVTAFTGDPDRAQYLMFTDGSGDIDRTLRWWRSAPLN